MQKLFRIEEEIKNVVINNPEYTQLLNQATNLHKQLTRWMNNEQKNLLHQFESTLLALSSIEKEQHYALGIRKGADLYKRLVKGDIEKEIQDLEAQIDQELQEIDEKEGEF